jgi:hypothetical protein
MSATSGSMTRTSIAWRATKEPTTSEFGCSKEKGRKLHTYLYVEVFVCPKKLSRKKAFLEK